MINIESEVFDHVANAVRTAYPSVFMSSEYILAPSQFPHVSLIEMSNTAYDRTQTSGDLENHASLMYEVNIYSNKKSGKNF